MNASIYKAEARDQSAYFVKIKRGHHHDISVTILELLHHAGIQHIIPPIKSIHDQLTQRLDDFTLIVYPFINGQDGFSRDLTDKQWLQLGETLKQIHHINAPSVIQTQIRQESYSPKWREAVRSLYIRIESEAIGDAITLQMRKFMRENLQIIHRLVNRAEALCHKLQNQTPQFVLCHSDIHGGNVLIDENDVIYIVDWDTPIMAPKERDLMFIGGGVANVWNKPHEEKLFYQGYGKTEINSIILAYYRHERIVEDIALYSQALLLTTTGGEDRPEMYKQFIAMFEPKGVIEIAFQTDNDL
jgi:spectinomycin phosphotransferase